MLKMRAFAGALLLATGQLACAQSALFDLQTRPVSALEIAAGAPAGIVLDLFVTTDNDLLSIALYELAADFYQHEFGTDTSCPSSAIVPHFPALSADSWMTTPGSTAVAGHGFSMQPGQETAWFDTSRDGAVTDHHFGRLTLPAGKSARLRGEITLKGDQGPRGYPFELTVDRAGRVHWQPRNPLLPAQPQARAASALPAGRSTFFRLAPRPVSAREIADGAPAGTVFDLFATTDDDILSVALYEVTDSFYQHDLGTDTHGPVPMFAELTPALGADSWFTTPGSTAVAGHGFSTPPGQETAWFDTSRDGAVTDHPLGRLTIPTGTPARLRGEMTIRNPTGPRGYLFELSVDSAGKYRWETPEPTPARRPPPLRQARSATLR